MTARVMALKRPVVPSRGELLAGMLSLLVSVAFVQLLDGGHAATVGSSPSAEVARGVSSMPDASLAGLSGALGAADTYDVRSSGGALHAVNPAQRMRITFERSRVVLDSGTEQLGLGLLGIGYGDTLRTVGSGAPLGHANRVVYRHAAISEWYANGPLGLEQGFTLLRAPSEHASGPLTLALAISGDAPLSLSASRQALTFGSDRETPALSYGALVATDASGRVLHSWIGVKHGRLLLRVNSAGARYPVRIDPLVKQGPERKLAAGGETGEARFGYSVALSADGNTALIGGPRDGEHSGAAWVFVRSGGEWQQEAKLIEPTGEGPVEHCGEEPGGELDQCGFGRRVALSADGNTALVGNPRRNGNTGAAWVFTRSVGTWTQQGDALTAADETSEGRFGKSVALSGDGSTALIGGSSDGNGHGAAWAFSRSGTEWTQQGPKLTATGGLGETHFGGSVALAADGNTALIGGPGDNEFQGAAWIFARSVTGKGPTWSGLGTKLTGGGENPTGAGHFGFSVALSADAGTALVGARRDENGKGAAWLFTGSGGAWSEQGPKFTGSDEGEEFGYSVALSSDGSSMLIGGTHGNGGRGAALLLKRSGTGSERRLDAGVEAVGTPLFGSSVALSSDAQAALVGAPNAVAGEQGKVGAAWVFGPAPTVGSVEPPKGPSSGGTTVAIGGANLGQATEVWFGATRATSFTINSDSSLTAVSPPGTGVVDVTVTSPYGTSAKSAKDRFTYRFSPGGGSGNGTGGTGTETPPVTPATGHGFVLGLGPRITCGASLVSRRIIVLSRARAAVKLIWRGAGSCRGKLTLRVKVKAGKRPTTRTIGVGTFSVAGGKARTVTIKLNALGRALLKRAHGRLTASLVIVNLPLGGVPARVANVGLTVQTFHGKPPKK
jgi:type IV secretory pathway TrbD component